MCAQLTLPTLRPSLGALWTWLSVDLLVEVRPLNPSVLWYVYTLQPGAPSCRSENTYTTRHALDRQPCTASDSARAVGRPLQEGPSAS